MQLELSPRQQETIASALTILAAAIILAAVALLFWSLGAFVSRFSGVFLPLAVSGVAALVFKPYFEWIHTRLKMPRLLALTTVFLSVIIPLVAFGWFFGALIVEQFSDMIQRLPEWWQQGMAWAKTAAPKVVDFLDRVPLLGGLTEAVETEHDALVQGLRSIGSGALTAGAGIASWVGALVGWAVAPIYFAFFLLAQPSKNRGIAQYLPFLKESTRNDVEYLVREFVDIIVAFFRGQIIIAGLQGLLFAIGFSLVGLKFGFVIGLTLGFLNLIPYLGNMVGLATALPLAFFQPDGGWLRLILVLIVVGAVQLIEGMLLTPKIMGDRTGLHPMVIIVAVLFWGTALSGVLGMILAIPLTAFLVVFWRLARERYVSEVV
ncbi:MAG: AI-2E family transporter [Acidobacteriota bacterium]